VKREFDFDVRTQVRGNFDSANTLRTGGDGDDVLEGGMANNTLAGGAGDDVLKGFMGDDYLVGGDGDDILAGMGSGDTLTGGAGRDTFVQNFTDTGHDIITDFNPSEDTIELNGVHNSHNVSVTSIDGGTLIDSGTGNTLFVANIAPDQLGANNVTIEGQALTFGPGDTLESILRDVGAELQGDTLNLRGFTGSQTFTGGAGDDTLSGGDGDDTLIGGAGDDTLDGGDQKDVLEGGAGDDLLKGGRQNDTLDGGAGDDILAGGQGKDTLVGGEGDDILSGGRGDDTLTGGAGADTFAQSFGETGVDTITDFNPSEDTINLKGFGGIENVSRLSVTEVDGGTVISAGEGTTLLLEGVTPDQLGVGNVTIDGEALSPGTSGSDLSSVIGDLTEVSDEASAGITLQGRGGRDTLEGGAGDDTLSGGDGDDTLDGGAGDDLLKGGKGADSLAGGAGDDLLKGGGGDDILAGGAGDDTLVGGGGAGADTLEGGAGDDILTGGAGDDTLTGGAGADTFVQNFSEQGTDTITDFDPSQDTIDLQGFGGVENVSRLSVTEVDGGTVISAGEGNTLLLEGVTPDQLGVGNVTIDGEALSPGTSGSDLSSVIGDLTGVSDEARADVTLIGGGGRDTLEGGAGDDVLKGGRGDDTLDGGAGDDLLTGGKGADSLAGGAGDDTLSGGDNDDTLIGGGGDDTLDGGKGADSLAGGAGDDLLIGGGGRDTLEGGAGDDVLKGGRGDDTLEGGAGDDILRGGAGDDTFVQNFSQPGADIITDFKPGQDTINFSGLNDLENISVEEADGGTLISAGEGNTLFVKGVTADQFSADNITIDGESVGSGLGDFDLGSVLGDAASEAAPDSPLDVSLGNSLDASTSQGGSVAESQAKAGDQGQAGAVSEAVADEAAVEEAVDEAAAS